MLLWVWLYGYKVYIWMWKKTHFWLFSWLPSAEPDLWLRILEQSHLQLICTVWSGLKDMTARLIKYHEVGKAILWSSCIYLFIYSYKRCFSALLFREPKCEESWPVGSSEYCNYQNLLLDGCLCEKANTLLCYSQQRCE